MEEYHTLSNLGDRYEIGGVVTIPCQVKDGDNLLADADSLPTYTIYKGAISDTPIATGTIPKLNDAGTVGLYARDITLSSASGFEASKLYIVVKEAIYNTETYSAIDTFYIQPSIPLWTSPAGPISLAGLTVQGVKKRLVGLESWLRVAARPEIGYTDSTIEAVISARVREFERITRFRINPVQVVTRRDGVYAVEGERLDVTDTYEVVDEPAYHYHRPDALDYMHTTLKNKPVRQVQRVRIILGTQTIDIPSQWYNLDGKSGKFYIVPYNAGVISITGYTLAISVMRSAYVPAVVHFDYIAGLPDNWRETSEWSDLTIHLEEFAALQVLYDISELYDAGTMHTAIQTTGIDQSLDYSRFASRKQELEAKVDKFHKTIMAQETNILLTGV